MTKKILALVTVLSLAIVSLTACKKNEEKKSEATSSTPQQ